jgi:rfaE bifunctional protein nucleotidyltransferase chain/domain
MSTDDPSARVLSFPELLTFREAAARDGKRVVLTNGCFDLLHRGHLTFLRDSACLGDVLVVAVNSDESVRILKGEGRPLHNEADRAFALANLRSVDAVFVFPGARLPEEIRALKPDIYTKAGDYTLDSIDLSEKAALLECGVEIQFLPFVQGHSTTSLIERSQS